MNKLKSNQRIAIKFYLPALGTVICIEEKTWYGYKTLVWTYPVYMGEDNYDLEFDNSVNCLFYKLGHKEWLEQI